MILSAMTLVDALHYGELFGVFLAALIASAYKAKQTARKVEEKLDASNKEIKENLEISDKKKDEKLDEIHMLVNGAKSDMLLYIVRLTQRLSEQSNSDIDAKAYEDALRDYTEHQKRCQQVNDDRAVRLKSDLVQPSTDDPKLDNTGQATPIPSQ